ncbi:serine hydrolase [Cellulophaga sp. Hel_I_12]|uniref:serine hydrolase n=1 Tax=Cellulophaga sp. Hel_I_12 TaxID=1249972 RepID=UPI0006917B98|nr:serine hydrolase [Cellulophaga sp. Hel_I_12]
MKKHALLLLLFLNSALLVSQNVAFPEMEKWLKENHIPTLGLGIINNGELSQIQVYGHLTPEQKAPYNTLFNVASLTKPITAVVALKLASQGKWNLDEPLTKYWIDPDIQNDARTKLLTTRHILSHQSGFPNWRTETLAFMFTPGTQYQYSGEGFEYLRKALVNKFNKSLHELASELIFEPLKMEDTHYVWDHNTDESRVALNFDADGKSYDTYKPKTENGADDVLTTIKDYGTFLCSVINGDGFSEAIFNDMQSNQVASTNGKHFALGFEKYNFKDGNYALSHGGSDKGVQTIVFIFPKTKQGLLIFTNVDDGYKAFEKILIDYLGDYGKEIVAIETGQKSTYRPEKSMNIESDSIVYAPIDQALYDTIMVKDKEFFDAYNSCDLEKQASIYAANIEFFHDKGGLITSKQDIIDGTEKNICGKVTRVLLEKTVEVYPINNYGAVEIGFHKFYNREEPDAESVPSKFIIMWHHDHGTWKMSKVVSLH